MIDEATVPRPRTQQTEAGLVATLTIIGHPNPERVPSQVRLDGTIQLSRTSPAFTQLSDGHPRPLADRFISRSPMVFKPEHDSVWIIPNDKIDVEADGQTLTEPTRFDADALERGVVLLVQGRVALLLHRCATRSKVGHDDLGLVGCSDALAQVRDEIRVVGDLPVPVLIRGESGTGKELIARAIHRESRRASAKYEVLNMATLSPALAASELFGHVRGAFTGADRSHEGCFVRADGGTLFLDEIGEAVLDTQAQLLRVLETHDLRPVGGSVTRQVDVRVIAATDSDLEAAVRLGRFREALFQRLAGFRIQVPPLRERRVDIGPLIYHFVRLELDGLQMTKLLDVVDEDGEPWVSAATIARLARYHWPGNVRELRNVVRQLVIAGRHQAELGRGADLEALLRPCDPELRSAISERSVELDAQKTLEPPVTVAGHYRAPSEVSEEELVACLRAHGYRLAPTAKALELSRTSLYTLVEQSPQIRKASELEPPEITQALAAAGGKLVTAAAALEVSAHALKLRMRVLGLV